MAEEAKAAAAAEASHVAADAYQRRVANEKAAAAVAAEAKRAGTLAAAAEAKRKEADERKPVLFKVSQGIYRNQGNQNVGAPIGDDIHIDRCHSDCVCVS